jgi:hypothetical protein
VGGTGRASSLERRTVGHRTSPSKIRLRKWVWLAAFTNGEPWVVAGGDGERLLRLRGVKGGGVRH